MAAGPAIRSWMTRGEIIHRMQKIFKDVCFPMLDEEVLKISASSPGEWKDIPDNRSGRDKTRTDLVERLGLVDIPFSNCVYRWGITDRVKKQMESLYYSGQFYRDYALKEDFFPDNIVLGFGARLWGFAVTICDRL